MLGYSAPSVRAAENEVILSTERSKQVETGILAERGNLDPIDSAPRKRSTSGSVNESDNTENSMSLAAMDDQMFGDVGYDREVPSAVDHMVSDQDAAALLAEIPDINSMTPPSQKKDTANAKPALSPTDAELIANMSDRAPVVPTNHGAGNGASATDDMLDVNGNPPIDPQAFPVPQALPQIPLEAAKVTNQLFMGNYEASQNFDFLAANRIKYVINCSGRSVPNLFEEYGVEYLTFYDWFDDDDSIILDDGDMHLNILYDYIIECTEDEYSVLVSSETGNGRCVIVTAAYVMRRLEWSLEHTLSFLASVRPSLNLNQNFLEQLAGLEMRLEEYRAEMTAEEREAHRAEVLGEEQLLNNTYLNTACDWSPTTNKGAARDSPLGEGRSRLVRFAAEVEVERFVVDEGLADAEEADVEGDDDLPMGSVDGTGESDATSTEPQTADTKGGNQQPAAKSVEQPKPQKVSSKDQSVQKKGKTTSSETAASKNKKSASSAATSKDSPAKSTTAKKSKKDTPVVPKLNLTNVITPQEAARSEEAKKPVVKSVLKQSGSKPVPVVSSTPSAGPSDNANVSAAAGTAGAASSPTAVTSKSSTESLNGRPNNMEQAKAMNDDKVKQQRQSIRDARLNAVSPTAADSTAKSQSGSPLVQSPVVIQGGSGTPISPERKRAVVKSRTPPPERRQDSDAAADRKSQSPSATTTGNSAQTGLTPSGTFAKLPDQLVTTVFAYLDDCDLVAIGLTCKRLYTLALANSLWDELYTLRRSWNPLPKPSNMVERNWRDTYSQKYQIDTNILTASYKVTELSVPRASTGSGSLAHSTLVPVIFACAADSSGVVHVWNTQHQTTSATLKRGIQAPFMCLASDRRRTVIAGGLDGTLTIWTLVSSNKWKVKFILRGHQGGVRALAVSGSDVVSASFDSTLRVWDLKNGQEKFVVKRNVAGILALTDVTSSEYTSFSEKSTVVSGGRNGQVRLWNTRTGKCFQTLTGHEKPVRCVSASGILLASGSDDAQIRIWNLLDFSCQYILQDLAPVSSLAFDGCKLFTAGGDSGLHLQDGQRADPAHCIRVFNIEDEEATDVHYMMTGHSAAVTCLHFDGHKLASACADGDTRLLLWDFSPQNSDN